MTSRRLDGMNFVCLGHSDQFGCADTTHRDRTVKRQYLDLRSAITTITKRPLTLSRAQHKDLVALSRDKYFLCVHRRLVYNRP